MKLSLSRFYGNFVVMSFLDLNKPFVSCFIRRLAVTVFRLKIGRTCNKDECQKCNRNKLFYEGEGGHNITLNANSLA